MDFKIEEFYSELSEIDIFSIFSKDEDAIFLDSSKEESKFSEFSFIGINKIESVESYLEKIYLDGKHISDGDSFLYLEKRIEEFKILNIYDNLPMIAGYIGYISYDMGRNIEKFEDKSKEDFYMPHMKFNLYENIIIFDLKNKKKYITAIGNENLELSINRVKKRIENKKEEQKEIYLKDRDLEFVSNFTRKEYINAVFKMKDYIINGDIYIANMTQRYKCNVEEDSYEIYKKLRYINAAPFSVYANYKDFQIISSSPERFIQIKDRIVTTRPIKGTRPRGMDKESDLKYKKELENSEKDKSELLMIVDLERNDLSKVCKNKTVKVRELFKIEEYPTVFHLVSTIEGKLKDDVTSVKCIRECFPGGSITGAPKIRAMEVIEELEGIKRNLYTGSIGYFDLRGNSDFNIVIRTILKRGNEAYFGVGGGVTYESIEEDEYEETLQKALALKRVLR